MHRSLNRKLVIGLVALAAAAFAGGAYAATQSSGSDTRQAFLNDVAKRLHVTPQQLSSALSGAYLDQLQAAVNDGRLTQAQANALEQRLKQNGSAPAVPFGLFGPRFARPHLFGQGRLLVGPGALPAAASYLGLTNAQLMQQLAGGKSLAQIATAKGKSVSGLEQALGARAKARLDKLVASKVITAAQEQKILSRLTARLAAAVNRKGPFPPALPPRLRFRDGDGATAPPALVPPAALPQPNQLPVPSA